MTEYVGSYADLYTLNMRRSLRNLLGACLYASNKNGHDEALLTPRVQVLELHYLFPDEEVKFRKLLDYLVKTDHIFVSFSRAVELIESGIIDNRYISFTFDDGYHNCLRAAEILSEYGASALFYLNSNIVGEQSYEKIALHCRDRINKPAVKFMDWRDVDSLMNDGHEIGGHSRSHFRLSDLNQVELEDEIIGDKEVIEKKCGPVMHFAWPYGTRKDITHNARDLIYSAGYQSCASAVRGVHRTKSGSRCFIHRDHVIAGWPHGHILFMLARSIRRSGVAESDWSVH